MRGHSSVRVIGLLLAIGGFSAVAQDAITREDERAIENYFNEQLPFGASSGTYCSTVAKYSRPKIIEKSLRGKVAQVRFKVAVQNTSGDIARDSNLIHCFGGQNPRRGETVDIVLIGSFRKTEKGWEFD